MAKHKKKSPIGRKGPRKSKSPRVRVKATLETLHCITINGEQSGCFTSKARAKSEAKKAEKRLRKELVQQKRDLRRELKRLGG